MEPLGPMEPWAAKSSMLAKEPWLGKAQVPKNSLESTLPNSPLPFFGPNSLKLFNSIMLLLSVVSMLPPWKLGCETSFLQSSANSFLFYYELDFTSRGISSEC